MATAEASRSSYQVAASPEERVECAKRLRDFLRQGLPLHRALEQLSECVHQRLRPALEAVCRRIRQGETLDTSLQAAPGLFTPSWQSALLTARRGGRIYDALGDLVETEEEWAKISRSMRRVTGGLILSLFLFGGASLFMLFVYFPMLSGSADSPLIRAMAQLRDVLARTWPLLLLALGAAGGVFYRRLQRPTFRRRVQELLLRIPGLGRLAQAFLVVEIASTTSQLAKSELPFAELVGVVADATTNPIIQRDLAGYARWLRHGGEPQAGLERFDALPEVVRDAFGVAARGGDLLAELERAVEAARESLSKITARTIIALILGALLIDILMGVIMLVVSFSGISDMMDSMGGMP